MLAWCPIELSGKWFHLLVHGQSVISLHIENDIFQFFVITKSHKHPTRDTSTTHDHLRIHNGLAHESSSWCSYQYACLDYSVY